MADVFVSYKAEDRKRVAPLVEAIEADGLSVWWDVHISGGEEWRDTIQRQLEKAKCVIVVWSKRSVGEHGDFVRDEASRAQRRHIYLPVRIDQVEPPLGFGEIQAISLRGWSGDRSDLRLRAVLRTVRAIMVGAQRPSVNHAGRGGWDRRGLITGGGLLAALAILLAGWAWTRLATSEPRSRVAVLPIKGLDADASVADSLTDQIATALNDGHIPTVSRLDSQQLTGGSDSRLSSLGIGYTISGTVERSGDTLHARLHFDDLVRHESLWSFEASGTPGDIAMFTSSVSRSIAGVTSCAYRGLGPGGLTDTGLLSRYLRACDLFVNHDDATDLKSTFELFDDLRLIIAKAPTFVPAQSDFAKFAAYLAPLLPAEQAAPIRAESARIARQTLKLDPNAADAYVAQELLLRPTDWARREALLRKAVSVDPRWPHSNGFLAMLLTETGRMREAAIYGQRAAAADLQIDWKPFGARMACAAGQTANPIAELKRRLANSPADDASKWALRWCLMDARQVREAKKLDSPADNRELEELRNSAESFIATGNAADRERVHRIGARLPTDASLAPFVILWSAAAGDTDTAFRFANVVQPGYPTTGIIDYLFMPQTESMRRDPRFFDLAKRYGLAQFWMATGLWPDFCAGSRMTSCKSAILARTSAMVH